MILKEFQEKNFPDTPGVYFFKKGSEILYIGKATSLKDRVRSYFSNDLIATRGPRLVDMITKSDRVEYEQTDSVLEALILEANLIKKHEPYYNIKEKDNRSFNYVVITKEDLPRVLIVRGRNLNSELTLETDYTVDVSFGPFPHTRTLREALRIIRKMFPFADKHSLGKDKYQFYRQLGLTPDTASEDARKEYLMHIKHIKLFFSGKKGALIASLKTQMNAFAKAREFEKAEAVKRRMFALEHIRDVSLIKEEVRDEAEESGETIRIEAYDTAHTSGKESVGVMTVLINGELEKSQYRKFKLNPEIGNNDVASLKEIISRRFEHAEWDTPQIVVIDGGLPQRNLAEEMIRALAPLAIVVSVVKDEKHKARQILGPADIVSRYAPQILLANAEAHRFAIAYHRKLRGKRMR